MSVVPVSQFELVRQRKSFQRFIADQSWHEVLDQESRLIAAVNKASHDSEKDMASLLAEMCTVIGVYRDLIDKCSVRIDADAMSNKLLP